MELSLVSLQSDFSGNSSLILVFWKLKKNFKKSFVRTKRVSKFAPALRKQYDHRNFGIILVKKLVSSILAFLQKGLI